MKYLKHKFEPPGNSKYYIGYHEKCIYCNKVAGTLFNSLTIKLQNSMRWVVGDEGELRNNQEEYLAKHTECISEEAYIIKSIIE